MAKRRVSVDMTGVEAFNRCPEGQWVAKLKKIELGEVQGSGDDALKAQFEVISGAAKGNTVFETFSLTEKALWKLKSFLQAAGVKSDGKLTLDLDKLEGKICGIEVIHDEYNGSKRAKISAYLKPSDLEEPDEDDEDEDEDEDDEDEDEDEVVKPQKKAAPAKKTPSKKKTPEPEDDEDEDEEDEEEPPAKKKPVKKAASSKKTAPAKKKPEPEDDEDDDDDDWEDDDD